MRFASAGLALSACCALAPLALAPAPAVAQPLSPEAAAPHSPKLDKADRSFLEDAARVGLTEMQGSKMALERSRNPDIKTFASQMIKDHTAASQRLTTLATSKGYELPGEPSVKQKLELKALDVSDESFDSKYIQRIGAADHAEAVNLFSKAAKEAKDPDVKAFAEQTLPTLQSHLSMAEALEGKLTRSPTDRPDTPAR